MTSEFTMQETAHYYMHRMRRLRDRISQPDYRRSLPDVMSLDSVTAFLDRVARDDLGVFADKSSRQSEAGRKEGR